MSKSADQDRERGMKTVTINTKGSGGEETPSKNSREKLK